MFQLTWIHRSGNMIAIWIKLFHVLSPGSGYQIHRPLIDLSTCENIWEDSSFESILEPSSSSEIRINHDEQIWTTCLPTDIREQVHILKRSNISTMFPEAVEMETFHSLAAQWFCLCFAASSHRSRLQHHHWTEYGARRHRRLERDGVPVWESIIFLYLDEGFTSNFDGQTCWMNIENDLFGSMVLL